MRKFSTSGAKALRRGNHFFAALKRRATQVHNCVSHKLNRAGTAGLLICAVAALCSAQSQMLAPTAPPAPAPKADAIYIHGNIYTGVQAAAQFSSVLREEAIAIWEKASGLKAPKEALFWWEIFASVKGAAIWISAAREFAEGRNTDPINAFSGWFCLAFHNRVLAERLGAIA